MAVLVVFDLLILVVSVVAVNSASYVAGERVALV